MATSSATIAVNFGTSLFLTLVSNNPAGTVAVSGRDVSLLPQTTAENQFDLLFQAGSGVLTVNGIGINSVSSTSVSVRAQAAGGSATATCTYKSFQAPAPTAAFTLFYTKQTLEDASEDPTIVFNPPSGVPQILIAEVPLPAAEVRV